MRHSIVLLMLLAVCSCSKPAPEAVDAPAAPIAKSWVGGVPVERFTQTYLAARKAETREPLVIAPEKFAEIKRYDNEPSNGVYQELPEFNASDYTECRVRLKATRTTRCRFEWGDTRKWSPKKSDRESFAVLSDGEFHDYTIDLQNEPFWSGTIQNIAFIAEPGGKIEVESCSLAYIPPKGPRRTTLANVTMESVDASRSEWKITVPANAQFLAHVGMLSPKEKVSAKASSNYTAMLSIQEKEPVALLEYTLSGEDEGWTAVHADLGAYAGQEATLILESTANRGMVPVWGNPMIAVDERREAMPIILISCDTTRADHLGCYGYHRDTSPNIDAFAREAVLFENAFTPETWTLTAHTSMLTGLYPTHHRVTATTNLSEDVKTLPEVLREAGYATAGFTGYRIWLQPTRGLSHGFDLYSTPTITRDLFVTLEEVMPWLDAHAQGPFFLFFHNYDHHSKFRQSECLGCDYPYYPPRAEFLKYAKEIPEPPTLREEGRAQGTDLLFEVLEGRQTLTKEEMEYCIALYDDSIRGVDHGVGELLDKLRNLGVYDDAIIIITADHGEQFGENGEVLHEHVYEGSARMPLLVRFPKGEYGGTRVTAMTGLIDIMPTILDVAKLESPPSDGQSLLRHLAGEAPSTRNAFIRRQRHIAVRTQDWKLIKNKHTGEEELYHIAEDLLETTNLIASAPPELEKLRGELSGFFDVAPHGWHVAFDAPNEEWRGTLIISSDDQLEMGRLLIGGNLSRLDLLERNTHSMRVLLGPLKREEVLVRTQNPNAKLLLRVESESEFSLGAGAGLPLIGMRYEAILDPAQPLAKIELNGSPELPSLRIWYEAEVKEGTAATPLTEEEKAALIGQGYVSEVQ